MSQPRFALIGAAGFVAPRHLQAIRDVGGRLVAAYDTRDSVGILDKYDMGTEFYTDCRLFERRLQGMRAAGTGIDWLSVCSPNHLHVQHTMLGLGVGANVLCEKPLCLVPADLESLRAREEAAQRRVYTVLQLRHLPGLQALRASTLTQPVRVANVDLRYVTPRGAWYGRSWKSSEVKSGGLITNIGIHMLDLLLWLFGDVVRMRLIEKTPQRACGELSLLRANVTWFLSIDPVDAPSGRAERRLTVDGALADISGFEALHTTVYQDTLAGRGHGLADVHDAVELAYRLRYMGAQRSLRNDVPSQQ